MKEILTLVFLKLIHALKVRQIIQYLSSKENDFRCRVSARAHKQAKFGLTATVHNRQRLPESISVGKNSLIDGELLVHDYGGKIEIGEYTYIGKGSRVWSGEHVKIGDYVLVAHNVTITDTSSHQISAKQRADDYRRRIVEGKPFEKSTIQTAPIIIGNHAWINFSVAILKGVRIGEGAIIGAGSVVIKDVPPWTLVAGVPAKPIRQITEK